MDRVELIERARKAHEESGRGMVVVLIEDVEPRYLPIEEAKTRFVERGVEPDLLHAVVFAARKYDPQWQAVLVLEQEDCLTVSIVGYNGTEIIGTISWTSVN